MRTHSLIYLLLLSIGLTPLLSAQGGLVLPQQRRAMVLDQLDAVLNREIQYTLADWQVYDSPFSPIVEEEELAAADENDQPVEPPEPDRLEDERALQVIASRFNPVGSLVVGSRGIIRFSNGASMSLNDRFRARIAEEEYEVRIIGITSNTVTLKLGDATLTKPFKTDNLKSSSRIQRGDNLPSEEEITNPDD